MEIYTDIYFTYKGGKVQMNKRNLIDHNRPWL